MHNTDPKHELLEALTDFLVNGDSSYRLSRNEAKLTLELLDAAGIKLASPYDKYRPSFYSLWEQARDARSEAVWNSLPDKVADFLEEQKEITEVDLNYMKETLTIKSEAVVTIRLLARLGEDELLPLTTVREMLLPLLKHEYAEIRYAVAEAFWQMADTTVQSQLKEAADKETHPGVLQTMEHVIRVFGG